MNSNKMINLSDPERNEKNIDGMLVMLCSHSKLIKY